MIFTVDQVRAIRDGRLRAALVLPSEERLQSPDRPEQRRLRTLRREYVQHDHEAPTTDHGRPWQVLHYIDRVLANPPRQLREVVRDTIDGERVPVVLTTLAVEDVNVYDTIGEQQVTLKMALACGYRTVGALRDAWTSRHPRSPRARIVYFEPGDLREKPRFLTSTRAMRPGSLGDYTASRSQAIDEAEALTRTQLDELAAYNRQKDTRRRADHAKRSSELTPAQRLARIEAGGETSLSLVKRELRVITQRLDRAERKAAA